MTQAVPNVILHLQEDEIVAVVHGCGVAYNRILREFGLSANEG